METHDLFWDAFSQHEATLERVDSLRRVAAAFRSENCHLAAGISSAQIVHAGWGLLDRESRLEAVTAAVTDFERCVELSDRMSFDALIALKLWSQELVEWKSEQEDETELARARHKTYAVLAERLSSFVTDERSARSYLVYGVSLSGPIAGPWTPELPDAEIDDSVTTWDRFDQTFCFGIPSVFQLLVRIGDHEAAWGICKNHSAAFCTPALRGWRYALEGIVNPATAGESFANAATAFEEDTLERSREKGQTEVDPKVWTTIGVV